MQATPTRSKPRGVYCRLCGSPIPLPASILQRESMLNQNEPSSAEHWRSKVFPHRCRTCGRETIYALNHIRDFEDHSPI